MVVGSFALHLVEASYLHTTLSALARSSRCLIICTPHKRPVVEAKTGWRVGAPERVHERVRIRLYVSESARPVEEDDEAAEVA